MLFPTLESEAIVQVNDKTRLNASKCFVSKDETVITKVEIKPSGSDSFIDVTGASPLDPQNWYLDWQYPSPGTQTVTVKLTNAGGNQTISKTISVLSAVQDALFSSDQDLQVHEFNILQYVKDGRSSFLDFHRKGKEIILDELNNLGYRDNNGDRLTAAAIIDVLEVKEWSIFKTLSLIFESISNATDDIFRQKSDYYDKMAKSHGIGAKAVFRFDKNNDAVIDDSEKLMVTSTEMVRK